MSIKLVDTLEPMADFPIAMAENIDFADGKSLQEKYDSGKLVSSAEAPVKVTDGKISLDTVPITKGGTGVTTQEDINKAFINNLEIDNSDVTDGTEFVSSYASDKGFADPNALNKPYKRQFVKVWNYIKDKISSVLGLTATNYGGTAVTSNKIEPNYTSVPLTNVTSGTLKYIKLADCNWNDAGTLQVYLGGDSFHDTLVINFGGGNARTPMLCGYYSGNNRQVKSVIAQKSSDERSNYSIYAKVIQVTDLNINVALIKGTGTINITESTTAPTNISEWNVNYGLFGTLTGNVTGNVSGSSESASKLTTARTAYVDLGTASTTRTIDWSGDTTIPVNGTLQVEHGGTGATTAEGAANSLIASLSYSDRVPVDSDYFISQVVNGGPFVPGYERRPISKLWEYIKGKISSVLGLTENNYGGTSASASYAQRADYPTGFDGMSDNGNWGDKTGSIIAAWRKGDEEQICFRYNDPTAGNVSMHITGRVYVANGNYPVGAMHKEYGYWGLVTPDGNIGEYIRTTTNGIIPYKGATAAEATSTLGTSSWYFSSVYAREHYGTKANYTSSVTIGDGVITYNTSTKSFDFTFS